MKLNHAVLFIRDAQRSVAFYRDVLGFSVVAQEPRMAAVFLRAPDSDNHHDLGLFEVGAHAGAPARGSIGLYHLAWDVGSLGELARLREELSAAGALIGTSDHGVSKSLYGEDPDGIEFEVMWAVPREEWGAAADRAVVAPLDLEAERARRGV